MQELTLHYSVSNGGDGSAYPQFSLSKEAVEIHQDIQSELSEGWGEQCTGSITVQSDSPIYLKDEKYLITKETLLESLEYYLKGGYNKSEAVKKTAQEFVERINKEL